MWTPTWTPKTRVLSKKRAFDRINISKIQKIGHLCVYFAQLPDFGAVDRNCAFSGAPRQTIINRLFCRQGRRCLEIVRQNILLSQNGSTLNSCRNSGKTKIGCPKGHPIFVVRSTGIEDVCRSLSPFIYKGLSSVPPMFRRFIFKFLHQKS